MDNKFASLQPLFDKYNVDKNDPSFTTTQKYILDRMSIVQNEIRSNVKQIDEHNNKIAELQRKNDEIRAANLHLDGQNQSLLDMLLNLQEEAKNA